MNKQQQQLYNQLFDSIANNKCNEVDALINDVELKDYINNETEYTKLLYAAGVEHNHVEMVETLLKNTHGFGYFAAPIIAEVCKKGHLDVFKLLLNARAFDPEIIKDNQMLLSNACLSGNSQLVDFLIKQGAEPNESTLNIACAEGHLPIVEQLIGFGIEVKGFFLRRLDNPFTQAAKNNQVHVLGYLLNSHKDKLGDVIKLLPFICQADNPDMLTVLAECGFDVMDTNDFSYQRKQTSYFEEILAAICKTGSIKLLNHLIGKTAENKASGNEPSTIHIPLRRESLSYPLHRACLYGHCDVVDQLLSSGADISAANMYNSRPLHEACAGGHIAIVQRLLESGDPSIVNMVSNTADYLNTPLTLAIRGMKNEIVSLDIVHRLITYGANINSCSPFFRAIYGKKPNIIEFLLELSPGIHQIPNEHGKLPLVAAVESNFLNGVELLLQSGADINQLDGKGNTALMQAVESNNARMVSLLLQSGANINIRYRKGNTVLHEAVRRCNREIITLLLNQPSMDISASNNSGRSAADLARLGDDSDVIMALFNEHQAGLFSQESSSSRRP